MWAAGRHPDLRVSRLSSRQYLDSWRIDVELRPGVVVPISRAALVRSAAAALGAAGAPAPASIGLILSDDTELAELNATHMGKIGPTDVLSFPLLPPRAFPPHRGRVAADPLAANAPVFRLPPGVRQHLGDIVVSVERAVDQAGAGRGGQTGDIRWSAGDELHLLVIHGVLHLCGWDHALPAEQAAMRALEQQLLARAT